METYDGIEVRETESTAAKLARWRDEITTELEGLAFFEAMGPYMVTEPCKSTHRQMVAENVRHRRVLEAMLRALDGGGEEPTQEARHDDGKADA